MSTFKLNKKVLLCLALILCTVAGIFAFMAVPTNAATSDESRLMFAKDKYYVMDNAIESDNGFTFEAEFSVPYDQKTKRAGVIIGNYDDHSATDRESGVAQKNALSVELVYESSMRKVRVYTRSQGDIKFNYNLNNDLYEADGTTPKYVKIAVVVDTSKTTDNYLLYVNGELKSKATNSDADFKAGCFKGLETMWIGADPRKENAQYFKGSIKNVAVYDDIRTAEEIANDATAFAPDKNDGNLLCAYNLNTLKVNEGYLNDLSVNGNNAKNPNWQVTGIGKTFTVNDDLHLVKDLDVMPQTFEAVVYAPETTSRIGVIFGNYMGNPAALNFELHNNGAATIHLDPDDPTGAYSTKIADVRNSDGFIHLVIVRERNATAGATYKLYVDGEYVTETVLDKDTFDLDMAEVQKTYKLQLGGDSRSGNVQYFKGNMKDVALYSEPLTAEEVYASYMNGVGTVKNKDNGLILHYDMSTVESSDYVLDVSGNGYHVTQGGVDLVKGRTFTAEELLYVQKKLEVMPKTYEALVYVPDDNRSGVILGNYGGSSCLNFEIHGSSSTPRLPSIYITDANGVTMDTKFNYSLTPNEWAHIVITHEVTSSGATFTCYVNGEKVDSFTTPYSYTFDSSVNEDNYLVLGGDCRSGNVQYYKGSIKNVALYSDVLTAAEIKELYKNGVDTDNASLILHYDLTKKENQTGTTVIDESGNGYNTGTSNVSPFFERTEEIGDYDYAFAIVGDTQKLVYHDVHNAEGEPDYVQYIYDWIVANKDSKKIQLVMGVGDITDKNEDAEYVLAKEQFEKLAAAGILYTITPGNHDMASGKYEKYNKYFVGYGTEGEDGYIPALNSLLQNVSGYYGPIVNGVRTEDKTQVANYYVKTEIEGEKYIVFSFEYGAPDDVLAWAGEICDANKDYKVIITTHAYMYRDGTTLDAGDVVPPNKSDSTSDDHRNNGDVVWDKFISQHENIVLVFSGHDPCPNVILRQDHGVNGNVVSQFLVDFQSMDTSLSYKTGMVAMLYISKGGNVKVEYISTYETAQAQKNNPDAKDMLYKERNCFEFDMYHYEYPAELITEYGLIPQQYANVDLYPFIIFNEKGECIGAESYFLDRVKEYNNEGALHVAKTYLSSNTWNGESFGSSEKKAYIVLRKDYVMASNENYNNVAQVRGSVVIDLNGYTITAPSGRAMVTSTIKPWSGRIDPTLISFVNGNINVLNHALIKFDAWDNTDSTTGVTTYVHDKIFSYTFENIKFNVTSDVSSVLLTYSQHSTTPTAIGNPDMNFVNCTFNLTGAKEGLVLFNTGNGYIDTKITVTGCEIVLGDNNVTLISGNDISGGATTFDGTVTFKKADNGNYTAITLPEGMTLPVTSVNDGELVFVKVGENTVNETVTYRLRLAEISDISYAPKMSITLANGFVVNVYVPVNYTQMFTFNGVTYSADNNYGGNLVDLDGGKYYLITAPLGSSEGAKELQLAASVKVGENEATATFTFSIPKYVAKVLADKDATDVEKTLARDVLAYIKEAYNYVGFSAHNSTEEIARVNTLITGIIGDYKATPVLSGTTNTVAGVTAVTLNLDATPTIRFYVTDNSIEFFANGTKLNTVSGTDAEYGVYVELDVYAYALCETVTYGNGGSYHISSFVNGAGESEKALVNAFVKYVESASAYRDQVIGK